MHTEKRGKYTDVWVFGFLVLIISFGVNFLQTRGLVRVPASFAAFAVGLLAVFFQIFVQRKPFIELYSKNYPYRKLTPYGVISAFILFECLLVWGLHTKQIVGSEENLFLISVVFAGAIVYYHTFVRMRISLRFLTMAILIPTLSAGAALGLASHFKVLQFVVPAQVIGRVVFYNTMYWILFNVFAQIICEEPAFRGYLMQRLMGKGEVFAVVFSSLIFAIWYVPFVISSSSNLVYISLALTGNLIMGAIYALLFIKGRNLLVAVLCHGIIDGLRTSLFVPSPHPGIREYINFLIPNGEIPLAALFFGCLLIGLVLLTVIPRKKTSY